MKTGKVITCEEHMINGGLGGLVAQVLAKQAPSLMEFIGVNDSFGESGTPDQLMEKYGLKSKNIIAAAKRLMEN
jgi:transketolase